MVRKVRHLVLRDSSFYARVSVPHALRVNVGKTELWAALSATSRAEAIRRLPATVARLQGRIDAARAEAKAIRVKATPPRRGRSLTPGSWRLFTTKVKYSLTTNCEIRIIAMPMNL